jgi:hypothetical protein
MDSKTLKKFIEIILLTLVISYGIDKLIFFGFNKISDNVMTGQAVGKLNQFLSVKDTSDFIVFGNSRANHHIDTELFSESSYNIGVDGRGIAFSSTLIGTLPKEKKQLILVHVDTKIFFDTTYDGGDIKSLKTKFRRNNTITEALDKSGQLSALQHVYYSMNYNGTAIGIIKNFFKPSYDHKSYNGYDPIVVSESQESMRDIVLSKSNSEECLDNYNLNPTALQYLKYIKSFKEKSPNKTFLFITSPSYNDPCAEDNKQLANIMKELNLTYWDYTNLYKDNKEKSLWKDRTHMSKKGAEAFSIHLLEKYKSLQN